ncbi:MAG: hypothetical protein AB8E82_01265 [Aureispira sp.]
MNTDNSLKQITLKAGVESVLDGADVMCNNIAETEYTLDSETHIGLTANLALPGRDSWIRLGKGQSFDFQDKNYEVVEVTTAALVVEEQAAQDEEE